MNPEHQDPAPEYGAESAETLGSLLRRTRQSRHVSLEEAAKAIRINAVTLAALEADNRGELPAEVFTRGFIKIYAQYLGLAPDEALQMYLRKRGEKTTIPDEKINAQEVLAGESMAESSPLITVPRIVALLLGLIILLVFYLGYVAITTAPVPETLPLPPEASEPTHSPPADLLLPGEEQLPDEATEADAATGTEETAGGNTAVSPPALPPATMEKLPREEARPEAGPATRPAIRELAPPGPIKKEKTTANGTPPGIEPATTAEQKSAADKPAKEPALKEKLAALPAMKPPYTLKASFLADTWLRIQIDGEKTKPLFFHAGDSFTWQAGERIQLFVGNAGGVNLVLNKTKLPPLGKPGQTARLTFPLPTP